MASSNNGQRAAKRRRASIRLFGKKQGRDRPINVRHRRGSQEKLRQGFSVAYQLVLTDGTGRWTISYSYWVADIVRQCQKTEIEARRIITQATEYAEGERSSPPVLTECASSSVANSRRLDFRTSLAGSIDVVERTTV